MFQQQVILDEDSVVEISTRLVAGETRVILSIRGKKSNQDVTVISASLSADEAIAIAEHLKDSAQYKTSL